MNDSAVDGLAGSRSRLLLVINLNPRSHRRAEHAENAVLASPALNLASGLFLNILVHSITD
jgi:hypothetical protein